MQEQSRPAMLENRLSRTASAVMLLFMAAALFGYNLFCSYSGISMPLWTSSVFELVILLIPCIMLCLLCKTPVPHARLGFKCTALVIGMGLTGYVFTIFLAGIWATVWTAVLSGFDVPAGGALDLAETMIHTPLWVLILVIALTPAVCEEFFFRGMLMKSMSANPSAAIVISAALFALLHYDLTKLLSTFAIGLFIGWVVMRSGNLTSGMILHFINNAMAVLMLKGMMLFSETPMGSMSEEALYELLMSSPDLTAMTALATVGAVLIFVLSIPLFFLCLILFLRDTKQEAEAIHLHALAMYEAGEDRDAAGRILLCVCGALMTVAMLASHGIFS